MKLIKKGQKRSELHSTIFILIAAFLVAIFIITYVFRSYQVDGPSMEYTLQNGNKLIIWKLPRTWARVTGHDYIPKRGDIIVFNEDNLAQFGQPGDKQLIKRVIGLPGDTVEIKNDKYLIINKQHPKGFDPDLTLPYGKLEADKPNFLSTTGSAKPIKLGPNQIFVSGDNRPDSLDSRDFGPINANQIVGQLVVRVLPFKIF